MNDFWKLVAGVSFGSLLIVVVMLALEGCALEEPEQIVVDLREHPTATAEHLLECDDPGEHGDAELRASCDAVESSCQSRGRDWSDRCWNIKKRCDSRAHDRLDSCHGIWHFWFGGHDGRYERCDPQFRAAMERCGRDYVQCQRQVPDIVEGCMSRFDGVCW